MGLVMGTGRRLSMTRVHRGEREAIANRRRSPNPVSWTLLASFVGLHRLLCCIYGSFDYLTLVELRRNCPSALWSGPMDFSW